MLICIIRRCKFHSKICLSKNSQIIFNSHTFHEQTKRVMRSVVLISVTETENLKLERLSIEAYVFFHPRIKPAWIGICNPVPGNLPTAVHSYSILVTFPQTDIHICLHLCVLLFLHDYPPMSQAFKLNY